MKFTLYGDPVAKARPRFSTRGGFARAYDPQNKLKLQVIGKLTNILIQSLNDANKKSNIDASNLASGESFDVSLVFHLPVNDSDSMALRNAKLWGLVECTSKPDVDNMQKFYLDCFNTIFYEDDRFVVKTKTHKKYTLKPRVEVEIVPNKNTLGDDVNGILSLFGPDHLQDIMTQMWELYDLYGRDEEGDWVADAVGEGNVREVRLARTAYVLSAIADAHSKALGKIKSRFPGFHKQAEKLAIHELSKAEHV